MGARQRTPTPSGTERRVDPSTDRGDDDCGDRDAAAAAGTRFRLR